jgi:hypothetical protein
MWIVYSLFISMGVGASTLAVVQFFSAVADGEVSPDERRMIGLVYSVLRIAMLGILAIISIEVLLMLVAYNLGALTPQFIFTLFLLLVLSVVTILHGSGILPSSVGPTIQVSTWYTLGIAHSLERFGYSDFNVTQFIFIFLLIALLIAAFINVVLWVLHKKRQVAPTIDTPTTTS